MKSFELLSRIALTLINTNDIPTQINSILAMAGGFAGVSRAYVFFSSLDGTTTNNEFEWCSPGVAPQMKALQNLPLTQIPSWNTMLTQEGSVCAKDVHDLPGDLVAALQPQGILALVAYPLYVNGEVRGCVGFDDCFNQRHWQDSELHLLRTVSGIVSTLYERRLDHERLETSERNLRTFFDTVDDLIIIGDTTGKIVHVNPAVPQKLGYSLEELRGMGILDLHPADCRDEAASILERMFARTLDHCPLSLQRRDGSLLPVDTRIWAGSWDGKDCLFGLSKDLGKEQEALQRFTRLFENNPALMAISSVPGLAFVDVNAAFLRTLGYKRDEVLGKTVEDLRLIVVPERHQFISRALMDTGHVENVELQLQRKDGALLDGLFAGEIIATQGRQYLLTVMVDITEQKRLQQRLSEERSRLANIIESTQLGTWEWNIQTGQTTFNERWAEILGYRLTELQPTSIDTWNGLVHPDDLVTSNQLLERHFRREAVHYDIECRMKHKDGRWVWVHDCGRVVEWDSSGRPLMMFGTHADITEKKLLTEQVRELSIRDPLTNAYNRRYAFERLEKLSHEYRRERACYSICMLDIDHFKQLNDTHGHLAGDHALREFAALVGRNLRPYDLLARFGGEEFFVASIHTNKVQAQSVIERIARALQAQTMQINDSDVSFTFSAGVADCDEFELESFSTTALVELADRRLYRAKELGRNLVVID